MIRQTSLAQTIDLAADKIRYDECAKKVLSYRAIIAWILKYCTKEFSKYTVSYIYENCLPGKVEISSRAVHQDEMDKEENEKKLGGNQRVDGQNTEANSIKEQTVYYDIRFGAILPGKKNQSRLLLIWKFSWMTPLDILL